MTAARVAAWVRTRSLTASDIDCVVAVMLKILDGKCKMSAVEKEVMALLYAAVQGRPGLRLEHGVHDLIAAGRADAGEAMRNRIYEARLLAETAISRPVMKAFKAMLREQGLFAGMAEENDAPE